MGVEENRDDVFDHAKEKVESPVVGGRCTKLLHYASCISNVYTCNFILCHVAVMV